MEIWWIVGIVSLIVFIVVVFKTIIRIVPNGRRVVIYRSGRFHRIAGPGPVQVIPWLDLIVRTLEVRDHIDSQWLTRYANELRGQFPEISSAVLDQMLASIEGVDVGNVQRLRLEQDEHTQAQVELEVPMVGTDTPRVIAKPKMRVTEVEFPTIFYNPYIAGPPIIIPEMFFGREQILQKIINILHNNNIMLTGPRRIGKTTLLHQLKNRLATLDEPDYFFIPIFVDIQGTSEQAFFHTVMDEIVAALAEYLPTLLMPTLDFEPQTSAYHARGFGKDLGRIIKALQQNHPGKTIKLVLLMDEMDVMNTYDQRTQSQLRSIFQKDLTRNLGIVVVGVNLRQEWERYESPFYNMFTMLKLEPLTPEQARELITKPVESIYYYDEAAIQRILAVTGGHPFHLQQLCLEITQRVAEDKQRQITLADVETTLANIHWIQEEAGSPNQEVATQPKVTIPPIVAEKRAPYHSPEGNEEVE